MILEPIFNPVWVAIGYGEMPGAWAVASGVVVIGAVTLRGVFWGLCGRRGKDAAVGVILSPLLAIVIAMV